MLYLLGSRLTLSRQNGNIEARYLTGYLHATRQRGTDKHNGEARSHVKRLSSRTMRLCASNGAAGPGAFDNAAQEAADDIY